MKCDKLLILIPQRVYAPKLLLRKFGLHLIHHCLELEQFRKGSQMLMIRDFENYFCVLKGKKLYDL